MSASKSCHGAVMALLCSLAAAVGADAQGLDVGPGAAATISDDGRYVAFEAIGLPPNGGLESQIYVRDRQTSTTTQVSLTSGGEQRPGHSTTAQISADGRFVVFLSGAALVAADANNRPDAYVHDRISGETTLVSVASDGTIATGGEALSVSISGDGRWVAFTSSATNLVMADTNDAADAFLHDRVTHATIRVSVSTSGVQSDAPSTDVAISDDGSTMAFVSAATTLAANEPRQCEPASGCPQVFLHARESSQTTRLLFTDVLPLSPAVQRFRRAIDVALSRDGGIVAVLAEIAPGDLGAAAAYFVHDRREQGTIASAFVGSLFGRTSLAISPDGNHVAISGLEVTVVDLVRGQTDLVPNVMFGPDLPTERPDFSADGRFVLFDSRDPFILPDGNGPGVFTADRDPDADGMLSAWERTFGLHAADASDAALDPDGDGVTNVEEFRRGSHPKGTFVRYLPEGASNAFFETTLTIFNPAPQVVGSLDGYATYVLRFLASNNRATSRLDLMAPSHSLRLNPRADPFRLTVRPSADFSTIVESNVPLVVDRTMTWHRNGTMPSGSHAETALVAPQTTWHLAEGATHGGFDLFYLCQNPNDADARVTVTFLRPAPLAPIVKDYLVAGLSRRTIWVDAEGPALEATDVSAIITSDRPILVERSMYYGTPGRPFTAGHAGAGIAAPATRWFLAEGATGPFFDLFVLVANPSVDDAEIAVTYLLPNGDTFQKIHDVAARSRLTIGVNNQDARLVDTAVSIVVESPATPVVVERAMWWPRGGWYEGHLSAGTTTTGTTWAIAEGEVDPARGLETFLLIANTTDTAGAAMVTLFVSDGQSVSEPVALPAHSRVTVPLGGLVPTIAGQRFSAIVHSDGPAIVVERAQYANDGSIIWAKGASSPATKLQ